MIDDLFEDGTAAVFSDLVRRPKPLAPPAPPGALSGLTTAIPRGVGSGVSKTIAFGSEIAGAFGSVAGAYPDALGVQLTDDQKKQAEAARNKLLDTGPTFSNQAGDAFRQRAFDLMPDARTSGTAARVLAGFSEFGAEVAGSAVAGPLSPLLVGGVTAFDTADELRLKGVDLETRAKAGAVAGAANAAMVAIPLSGATRAAAFAKGAAVGEGATVGQTAAVQTILKHAGYDKIASQYDPFDPVALAVGLVPGVLGAALHSAPAPRAPLVEAVRSIESGGRPAVNAQGVELEGPMTKLGTAKGDMQVLDSTALAPGHGIAPAQVVNGKIDPADRTRVGEELIGKLTEKYGGDTDKGMAAYNWGEGNLDRLLAKNPDDWQAHLPAETSAYVAKGRALLGESKVAEAVRADPDLAPAARVVQTSDALDRSRLTADDYLAGHDAHEDALQQAHDQLARGDRIEVADTLRLSDSPDLSPRSTAGMIDLGDAANQLNAERAPPAQTEPAPPPIKESDSAKPVAPPAAALPGSAATGERSAAAAAQASIAGAAHEIATLRPDMMVHLDGMAKPMRVADFLEAARKASADDAAESGLVQAAANCLLRNA